MAFPRRALLLALAFGSALAVHAAPLRSQTKVGDCIWASTTRDRQECRFVRRFKMPAGRAVSSALLRITADNSYRVFLDGELIGQGGDWRVLIEYDLHLLLTPGEHVLAVAATNDFDVSGLVAGLTVAFEDGGLLELGSDASWKLAPDDSAGWQTPGPEAASWPAATVLPDLAWENSPQIYHAPTSTPTVVPFWRQTWVQLATLAFGSLSAAAGLYLGSRLLLKSQAERIVRRERARIADDLHDTMGGGLTRLMLLGQSAAAKADATQPGTRALSEMSELARELMAEMNDNVWLINSRRDTLPDLASYLARYAETFFRETPLRCRFDVEAELPNLACDLGVRRNLLLAVKEALNNALRHSGATEVELAVRRVREGLLVSVRDNGRGFSEAGISGGGNGLRTMRARAEEFGGQFRVHSAAGAGTRIEFLLSLGSNGRLRPPGRER